MKGGFYSAEQKPRNTNTRKKSSRNPFVYFASFAVWKLGARSPLPANGVIVAKTPSPPSGMEERAGESRRVGFQSPSLRLSPSSLAGRESGPATTFGNGGCVKRRPQGHAALSRQTLVKPPALPEVADFHLSLRDNQLCHAFSTSRQAVCSFFKFALDFASM